MDKFKVLSRYFGYTQFRPGQEELIDSILSGRDVFGILPTGGGKSLCYQIPALMLPGITVVISPLISLMQDQVMALKSAGIPAAYLNSTLTASQMRQVYRNLMAGQYKIIYAAPERLDFGGFDRVSQQLPISFVAVDEAHCISQWGQDFRPSYLRIVHFIDSLPRRPVVGAYTATATRQVQQDVERILKLRNPAWTVTGYDRPNLFFEVIRPEEKEQELLNLMAGKRHKSGIVYCATRKNVEHLCQLLLDHGYQATRYHAGLSEEERRDNQKDFVFDRKTVMVATNAFGMGIDKSNVSYVIHYNMPRSIEAYYQEAGRAGRDGSDAECILLYSGADVATARYFIDNGSDNEELSEQERDQIRRQDLARLEAMTGYCKTEQCLRGYILDYFGQKHPEACGHCSNCRRGYALTDVTQEAQMILSCMKRIYDRQKSWSDITLVIRVLQGSRDRRVIQEGLQDLSTYGLMKGRGSSEIRSLAEQLEQDGYVRTDENSRELLLEPAAARVLYQGEEVQMLVRREEKEQDEVTGKKLSPDQMDLLEELKELRSRIAKKSGVPPHVIFSNATLTDIVRLRPKNQREFRKVAGIGEIKAAWYGKQFLETIKRTADF